MITTTFQHPVDITLRTLSPIPDALCLTFVDRQTNLLSIYLSQAELRTLYSTLEAYRLDQLESAA